MNLAEYRRDIERALDRFLPEPRRGAPQIGEIPHTLGEAMRYSLLAGGKRLRPAMLLAAVDMLGGDREEALGAACALEMIHTYSLIHDDLPGMDDDAMRRGRPANHVAFGEGQAILAGDGLLTLAFELSLEWAMAYAQNASRHIRAIHDLAAAAGVSGMVAGQSMDLLCERGAVCGEEELRFIQINKTARLFIGALRAGAHLCGAGEDTLFALTVYGTYFGRLFQTADDILDAVGDAKALGKSTGKDAACGKLTALCSGGVDGAREQARALCEKGICALEGFGGEADFFRELIRETAQRVQ